MTINNDGDNAMEGGKMVKGSRRSQMAQVHLDLMFAPKSSFELREQPQSIISNRESVPRISLQAL